MSSLGAPTLEKVYAEEEKPKGLKKSAASGGLGPTLTTVVVLLVVVAVLSTAAALVLAVMVLGEDGSSGSPTSPPVAAPTKPVTSAPTNFPSAAPTAFVCPTVELGVEIRAPGDYIGLIFPACPSEATFEAFTNAAARWNSIITSNRITPFTFGEDLDVNDYCGFPSNGYNIGADDVIDHLTIFAETVDIDGAGGILGAAGPCFIDENFFPVIGGMIFDNADLAGMEQDGTLKFVITHEMGHVLGIGTLFDYVKQGGGAAGSEPSLAADLIFDQDGNAHPQNHGKFLGVAAIGSFSDYSGKEETFVPLEDGRRADGSVFMSPSNGQGSLDGHWKITTFDNELMTFAIDSNEPLHPLSEVSIASLGDMGYAVDLAQADPFSLPSLKQLRSEKKGTKMLDLSHDILNTVKDIKTKHDVVAKRKARAKALP